MCHVKKVVVDVPCRALDLRANYCMLVTSTLYDSRGLRVTVRAQMKMKWISHPPCMAALDRRHPIQSLPALKAKYYWIEAQSRDSHERPFDPPSRLPPNKTIQ